MAQPTTPSALHAFFIFNPELGEEVTEARKLLYFCDTRPETQKRRLTEPNYVDLNYESDMCGMAEGLIAFTREFAPKELCESVHCQQHRYAFSQPEHNYWLVLVVTHPTIITRVSGSTDKKELGGSQLQTDYLSEKVEDAVLQAILHRCYSLFQLFNSTFEANVKQSSHDGLRAKLNLFMTYFLPTIRFSQLIYFTDIHGFQFLPVDKITFLTIQYIINLLTLNFAGNGTTSSSSNGNGIGVIKNCALMYNNKLIYSGLNSEIMFLLYSLDQDLMYWFLVEYLTAKENLHSDILNYITALKQQPPPSSTLPAWSKPGPATIPGIYNIPESVYERHGRLATNRKAFEKAVNKGEVSPDVQFVNEEDQISSHSSQLSDDDGVLLDKDVGRPMSRPNSTASGSGANTPIGFMTGPFRSMTSTPPTTLNSMNNSPITAPGINLTHSTPPPCNNSPIIYLDGIESKHSPTRSSTSTTDSATSSNRFGSGQPSAEANNPIYHDFPGSRVDSTTTPSTRPLRLVVYQKYKITLFLIVEDEEPGQTTNANDSPNSSVAGIKTDSTQYHPSMPFYSTLESFMESNLKKLGDMLHEQTVRLNLNGTGSTAEEPFRFLYFNHMNLALKTSLTSNTPPTKGSGATAGTSSILTMETIKIIRELHQDFNTHSFKAQTIASMNTSAANPTITTNQSSNSTSTTTASPTSSASSSLHSVQSVGSREVCVKTSHHGWVVGRRATQSHREFFLLLDEKITHLGEIQEEVETLARTYFYNIFIQ